jgi:hypothetical protein
MRKLKFTLSPRIAQSPLLLRKFLKTIDREKKHLQLELAKVAGLMPLLMKPRNKQKWSQEDKAELVVHLKRLSDLSPYIAALFLPGGFAMLPVLAWWLDRRRGKRALQPA